MCCPGGIAAGPGEELDHFCVVVDNHKHPEHLDFIWWFLFQVSHTKGFFKGSTTVKLFKGFINSSTDSVIQLVAQIILALVRVTDFAGFREVSK